MAQEKVTNLTNPHMVEAIAKMKEDLNPRTQSKMITEMLRSKFIVPVTVEPSESSDNPKGSKVTFNLVENKDKQKFFMAFTDFEELKKWGSETNHVISMQFDDFARLVIDQPSAVEGFVINPFNENIIFTRKIMIDIREQRDRHFGQAQASPQPQVVLREPETLPEDVCTAAIKYFKEHTNVNKAYIQEMLAGDKEGYLIVLDFTGIPELVLNELKAHLVPVMGERPLTLLSVDIDAGRVVSERAKAPFYEKDVRTDFVGDDKRSKKKGLFKN